MLGIIEGLRAPTVTPAERNEIIERIVTAPFNSAQRTLADWFPGDEAAFVGRQHPSRPGELLAATTEITSLEQHVLKHSIKDQGWPLGTTSAAYLSELRQAVRQCVAIDAGRYYFGRWEPRVAICADAQALRPSEAGASGRTIFVLYNPSRGKVISGYVLDTDDADRKLAKWRPRHKL